MFERKSALRWLVTIMFLFVFSALLSACAGEAEETTAGEESTDVEVVEEGGETDIEVGETERPFEGQTVTVAVGSFMSSGVTMFEAEWEERTGADLQVVEIPFGDLYSRLFASFNAGAGEIDVAIYAANWIPEFALADHILSLEEFYPEKDNWDEVLDKTQQIMYVGGNRYSVPMDGDVIFGYYRKSALENPEHQERFQEEYGYELPIPPETWEQYHDIAEFFTGWDWSGDGEPDWGVLEAQGPRDVGAFIFTSRAAAYAAHPDIPGSLFFDPETMEPVVDNPGWVQALEDWIAIKEFGPPEMAGYGGGDVRGNYVAGNYALAIDWADIGVIAQDENASIVKGDLGYFVLPGSTRVWNISTESWDEFDEPQHAPYLGWGGWHGSVAAASENPAAAWDFLNYIDTTENSIRAVTTPGTARNPYRTPHFEDPELWEEAPVQYEDPGPYLAAQEQSMQDPNAQFDLRIPKAGQYFEILDNWVQQALAGAVSSEEALENVAAEWAQLTERTGIEQQSELYRGLYGLDTE